MTTLAKSQWRKNEELLDWILDPSVDMKLLLEAILEGQEELMSGNCVFRVKAVSVSHILKVAQQFEIKMEKTDEQSNEQKSRK